MLAEFPNKDMISSTFDRCSRGGEVAAAESDMPKISARRSSLVLPDAAGVLLTPGVDGISSPIRPACNFTDISKGFKSIRWEIEYLRALGRTNRFLLADCTES